MTGASLLAGIGLTMAPFIANLASDASLIIRPSWASVPAIAGLALFQWVTWRQGNPTQARPR